MTKTRIRDVIKQEVDKQAARTMEILQDVRLSIMDINSRLEAHERAIRQIRAALTVLKARVAARTTAANARGKKARRPTGAKESAWTKRTAKVRAKLRAIETQTTPGPARHKPRRATIRANSKS